MPRINKVEFVNDAGVQSHKVTPKIKLYQGSLSEKDSILLGGMLASSKSASSFKFVNNIPIKSSQERLTPSGQSDTLNKSTEIITFGLQSSSKDVKKKRDKKSKSKCR